MERSTFLDSPASSIAVSERSYLRRVFSWMFVGLALTSAVAVYFSSAGDVTGYFNDHVVSYYVLLGVQLGLVFGIVWALPRISSRTAAFLFCLYAGLTGVTFSVLLEIYTSGSVVGAFAGATGVFAGMATYGYVTDRDLSGLGGILVGALVGFLFAAIAYAFIGGSTFNLILGIVGVLLFSVLTAYDMQKIKTQGREGFANGEDAEKLAIFGALALYLDFINLFISLLRIFGARR